MDSDLELAIAAAEAGAAMVRAQYGAPVVRHDKSATDFATDTDLAAEQEILGLIQRARPQDAIVGEETGTRGDGTAPRRWLVDPLCGTLNFAARTPLFSVNVALQLGTETAVAAVADPVSGETFWTDGATAGVRRDGSDQPIAASAESRLVDVNLDRITDGDFLGSRLLTDDTFRQAFGQRVLSTTLAVAWVAAGRRAAYVTDGNLRDSVHFTAGLALCRAAGCVVTDLRGQPLHSGLGVIAAADARTHATLLDIVARHLPEG
ncbi:inositol monophosphatase family protein [Kribbella sp. NPDC051620]|uniref:inositol monophosphatase family protein n=1 Tax=Kribbella sp. NPDC051620 TaxID=3364120 RepID=UPI00378F4081